MVKNRHFLPFFGPKTPFFAIFWHPVYPPSKTPFLAVLPPPPPARPASPEGAVTPNSEGSPAPTPWRKRQQDTSRCFSIKYEGYFLIDKKQQTVLGHFVST
jgi:hypothetical protein